ncbi:unnamed protein product [Prunus armeniaca]|uniref:Uncharacterized protein n=1 Tax=Prunus armeniaca TaxID=36596 RepID=A0A6J5Y0M1_PRUAR|nr:unnamed protein product [Prunus armeniaca]CAB4319479.1 unnamed protein product [Prunus armeniaca]
MRETWTRGRSVSILFATRRMGAIDVRAEGTTSLLKTSVEKEHDDQKSLDDAVEAQPHCPHRNPRSSETLI